MTDYPDLVDEPAEALADAPEETPPPARADASPLLAWLASEGYRPELDEDGDVRFRHEGRTLYVFRQDGDPGYLAVGLPAAWDCEDAEEATRALDVSNRVNRDLKAVKCVLHDNVVWITVEQFVEPPDGFRAVLPRCIDVLGSAAWHFRERMRASG